MFVSDPLPFLQNLPSLLMRHLFMVTKIVKFFIFDMGYELTGSWDVIFG